MGYDGIMTTNQDNDRLLRPRDVAELLACDPKTVTRWAAAGLIPSTRTPGGHRRIRESVVLAIMDGKTPPIN